MISGFIQLPRNFFFISALPARFMMTVMAEGNATAKGVWYDVQIGGHRLNILSEKKLKPGAAYEVEKTGGLQLKLLKEEIPVERRGHPPAGPVGETAVNSADQPVQPPVFLRLDELLFRMIADEEGGSAALEPVKKDMVKFRLPVAGQPDLQGIFIAAAEGWHCLLAEHPLLSGKDLVELKNILGDLPVTSVNITPEKNISSMSGGIDLLG